MLKEKLHKAQYSVKILFFSYFLNLMETKKKDFQV